MSDRKRNKSFNENGGGEEGNLSHSPVTSSGERIATYFDRTSPANLPPELWEQIFKNLESPKDLVNCWNTTSAWSSALRSTDLYFKMTLQFLLPYLSKKDFLSCSSVSKSWNASVDISVQTAEKFNSDYKLMWHSQRVRFTIQSQHLTECINNLLTNPTTGGVIPAANPVAYRRVHIKLWFDEPFSVQSSRLLQCLDRRGHLIHYLDLNFSQGPHISCLDQIKLIHNCFQRTPNLCACNIVINSFITYLNFSLETKAFNDFIGANPWPEMKHLNVLKFDEFCNRTEFGSIANAYGPQLLYLQFLFPLMNPRQLFPPRFSNLQRINYSFDPCVREFGRFVRLSRCPLIKLTVDFDNATAKPTDNYDGIVEACNAASGSLEILRLFPSFSSLKPDSYNISKFNELRLPKLKMLHLWLFGYPSVDFLKMVCPAVEKLKLEPLYCNYSNPLGRQLNWEMFQSGDIYCDLYSEHQFWSELRNMRRVDVEILFEFEWVNGSKIRQEISGGKVMKSYTRSVYEAMEEADVVGDMQRFSQPSIYAELNEFAYFGNI